MMFYCREGIIRLLFYFLKLDYFTFSNLIISLSPGLKSEIRKYWNTKNILRPGGEEKEFHPAGHVETKHFLDK